MMWKQAQRNAKAFNQTHISSKCYTFSSFTKKLPDQRLKLGHSIKSGPPREENGSFRWLHCKQLG